MSPANQHVQCGQPVTGACHADPPLLLTHLHAVADGGHQHLRLSGPDSGAALCRAGARLRLGDGEDALDADRHPHGWDVLAAEHADQLVVPAACTAQHLGVFGKRTF